MQQRLKRAVTGTVVLTAAAGLVLSSLVSASAAGTAPQYEPDTQAVGNITLYSSTGAVITSGHVTDKPLAAYYVGDSVIHAGDNQAVILAAQPNHAASTANWNADYLSNGNNFPLTAGPANIQAASATYPVAVGTSGDLSLSDFIGEYPNEIATGPNTGTANAAYQDLYQLRLETQSGSSALTTGSYDVADILVNETAGTWTQVYPTDTATALGSSENPSTSGDNVTFTATVTPAEAGNVTFTVDGTAGTPVAVNTTTGVATYSTTALAIGSHSVSASYMPTDKVGVTPSTSATVTQVVTKVLTKTTTTLGITNDTTTPTTAPNDPVLSGTVSAADSSHPAGSVLFYDGTSTSPITNTATPVSTVDGTYSYTLAGGFSAGSHSIVAKFTPNDTSTYNASQSQAQAFYTNTAAAAGSTCSQTGSSCSDTQGISATIPTGTLVISSPYTSANPLNLGTLALSSDGTYFTGTGDFQCITVTDSTSGASPFVASGISTALNQVGGTGNSAQNTGNAATSINAENVGLTALAKSPGTTKCPTGIFPVQSYTGTVTPTDNPAAHGVTTSDTGSAGLGGTTPHTVLTGSAGGDGTATYDGTLTINAPTSTAAGTYTGTIVFTVTD